ncbi:phosphotransferase [Marispirochaeta aestuarii]|uniref:phosphotransferase n=1 Tax=Marispirochaeta aestuarii TaxID=1963862 RepID=UPI0029C97457|nr:phosphotransferase [Marispirochaeta aestuarii]
MDKGLIRTGSGSSAEVFKASDTEAFKLYYPGYSLLEVVREYENTSFVRRVYEKAPWVQEPGQREGRITLPLELIQGRGLAKILRSGDAREVGMSLGIMHRDLHVRPSEGLPPAKSVFEPVILDSPGVPEGKRKNCLSFLRERRDDRLCHGCFHPGNIVQTNSGWRLINWKYAFSGDPLADVAATVYHLRSSSRAGRRSPVLEPLLRDRLIRWYLKGYFGKEEIPRKDITIWMEITAIRFRGFAKERLS